MCACYLIFMDKKIRVAFLYKKSNPLLSPTNYDTTYYHFFMDALKRNSRIDVTYFPTENKMDVKGLKNRFDIILLYENWNGGSPDELIGINELGIPVIARCGDFHAAQKYDTISYHEKYRINHYFGFNTKELFYRFYPKNFKYKPVIYGLEPSLYQNVIPFKDRIKNRILNSGAIGNTRLYSRVMNLFKPVHGNPYYEYRLRTKCNKLPYVDYTSTLQHEFIGDKYPLLLQKYQAAIAATTFGPTIKYWEIPAAGCLTFMEITKKNGGEYLGYTDGETAIFINEDNYEEKFKEFLRNPDDPKWEKIANAGRKYALENLNNDKAVDSLVDLMEEFV